MVQIDRTELANAKVTIDGHRAKIAGIRNDFATVHDLETGAGYEFSWSAVARIVGRDGKFKS